MSDNNIATPVAETPAQESAETQVENNTPEQEAQEENAEAAASSAKEESSKEEKKAEAAKKEEVKRNIKKLKLKVDGVEEELALDLDNEQELVKHLQLSKAAQKKMQQAAEERKQMEQLLQIMQKSPERVMKELGLDPEEFAVALLNKKLEEEAKSPEQREKERLQKELEELKEKYKKDEEERKAKARAQLDAEIEKKLEDGITSALETGGLPKTPYVVKKMAETMYVALENGINLDPSEVLPLIKKEMEADIKEFFGAAPDDVIEAMLGKERLNNMRKAKVAAVKKAASTPAAKDIKPTGEDVKAKAQEAKKEEKKKISLNDWLRG